MESSYNQFSLRTRSEKMESAALLLGAISLIGSSCLYLSVVCGALAILLALLSKGGMTSMSRKAKAACFIGSIGICVTIVLYAVTIFSAYQTYGSWEGVIQAYCNMYGLDYSDVTAGY